MEAHRQFYKDVHIVFRKSVEMRWLRRRDSCLDYFGEWSPKTDKPHGRGIWFGGNAVRVGYFKDGEIARGKVLTIVNDNTGSQV